jgi:hypothetical protein
MRKHAQRRRHGLAARKDGAWIGVGMTGLSFRFQRLLVNEAMVEAERDPDAPTTLEGIRLEKRLQVVYN